MSDDPTPEAPSARTKVRRGANRADYATDTVHAILDAGLIAHVGVQTPDGPLHASASLSVDGTVGAAANPLLLLTALRAEASVQVPASTSGSTKRSGISSISPIRRIRSSSVISASTAPPS